MTVTASSADEEQFTLPELPVSGSMAQSAQRAYSVSPEAGPALSVVTESDGKPGITRAQEAAQALADTMSGRIKAQAQALAAGPSLWHVRPPTLAEEWQYLRDCIDHLERGHWKFLRAAYGVLRLPFILAAYALQWATRSPWGFLITCALGFVIWTYI